MSLYLLYDVRLQHVFHCDLLSLLLSVWTLRELSYFCPNDYFCTILWPFFFVLFKPQLFGLSTLSDIDWRLLPLYCSPPLSMHLVVLFYLVKAYTIWCFPPLSYFNSGLRSKIKDFNAHHKSFCPSFPDHLLGGWSSSFISWALAWLKLNKRPILATISSYFLSFLKTLLHCFLLFENSDANLIFPLQKTRSFSLEFFPHLQSINSWLGYFLVDHSRTTIHVIR